MNDYGRAHIISNIPLLIRCTVYEPLVHECLTANIITIGTIEQIEKLSENTVVRHGLFFEQITHIPQNLFTKFLEVLADNFPIAFHILRDTRDYTRPNRLNIDKRRRFNDNRNE